jgi:hypothetical protein
MSLRGRSGSWGRRSAGGSVAVLSSLAIALTPGRALAQGDEMERIREQQRQSCILVNGDPDCMVWHPHGPPRPAPPPKPDVWGAIAVSTTLFWGASWNKKTREEAERDALQRCHAGAGESPCKIKVSVADVCVSLVISSKEHVATIGGPTGATNYAEAAATLRCQRAGGHSCKVMISFCADGGGRRDLKGHTEFSNGNPIFVPGQATAAPGRR